MVPGRRLVAAVVAVAILWIGVVVVADRLLADHDWAPYAVFIGLWLAAVLVYGLLFNRRGRFGRDLVVVVGLAVVAAGLAAGWGMLHPMSPIMVAPG